MTETATTIDLQWDDPVDAQYSWRRNHGPLTRFYEDAYRVYYRHLKDCWEEVASPMAKDHIVTFMHGFTWVRGAEVDDAAKARSTALMEKIGPLGMGGFYREELRPEVVEIVTRLRKHPKPTVAYTKLVDHLDECVDAASYVIGNLHWKMAAGSLAGGRGPGFHWPDIYHEITGRPKEEGAILVGGATNELTKAIRKLYKLARLAASDTDLLKVVESGDVEALNDDGPAFVTFRRGFNALLREYGQRNGGGWGSATTWESPTWSIRPDIPLGMIASYAKSDLDAVIAKERAATRDRKRLEKKVRGQLANDPSKLAQFEQELAKAMVFGEVIEDHNHWMDQCAPGVLREALHNVALRLVRDGVIDDPYDVVHLSRDELRSPPANARDLVAERKALHEKRQETEFPETIGAGEVEPNRMAELADKGEGQVGNELRGVAASPGTFTGVARVREPSPIFPDVDENEILVAVDAGPNWTPVFAILGAVVLDKGAAWQHAAVMAREFGIPAVTGTVSGTEAIKDGDTITVDGDAGVVTLGA